MSPLIYTIITFSNVVAATILILRITQIDHKYLPFAFFIWIAIFNDTLSYVLAREGIYTIVNNNVYVLIESLLILLFFKKLKLFKGAKTFSLFSIFCLVFWLVETKLRSIAQVGVEFRIFYSFLVVILSINFINTILMYEKRSILRNASFLICVAFILYFTLKALINAFWMYGFTKSRSFLQSIQFIMMYLNLLVNVIYALASLWIPKKQASILPS